MLYVGFYVVEIFGAFFEKDEAVKEKKMNEMKEETVPFYMSRLDTLAGENDGHLANGQVCVINKNPNNVSLS